MLRRLEIPWILAIAAVYGFDCFVTNQIDPYVASIFVYAGINITLAVSLNLINGFTGQFSMGHAGFMAIGAYSSAVCTTLILPANPALATSPFLSGLFFFGALLVGGLMAALSGYIVGLPSLRLRGDYLAIVTLGFGEIIRVALLNIEYIGGARGLVGIPAFTNLSWVYGAALLCVFFVSRLIASPWGRELLAVREDEIAAQASGVNTTKAKVFAFVSGAFFAGVAGGLFAHYLRFLNPAIFDISKSFEIIIMVVLGGMGSISGSICAAIFLTLMREQLRDLAEFTVVDYRMVIYSLMLIILMLTRPNGIFGSKEIWHFVPQSLKRFFQKGRSDVV
jgi:branched-chain amino acid transport system permease protein